MIHPVPSNPEQARKVIRAARAILTGSVGVIDGARQIADVHLYSSHVEQPQDKDYMLFLDIDSKTSHLPIGEARKHWAADALLRKDEEIKTQEDFYRESALRAAQNLVSRLARCA